MDRGKRSKSPAQFEDAAIMHTIAQLRARAHEQAARTRAPQMTVAGEFAGKDLPHARGKRDELFLLVFNSGSYALHAFAEPVAPSIDTLAGLGAQSLNRLVDRVASFVQHSPETFLGAADPATATTPGTSGLTEGERRALTEGGVDLESHESPRMLSAADRTRLEFGNLLVQSLSVDDAARMLKVDSSRIRQRLGGRPRSLFGIKMGRTWRIPKFQFYGRRLVPGIDAVVANVPLDLSPVAVFRWFTTPNSELELDSEPVTPLEWLKGGNAPARAAELAAALG